MSAEKLIEKIAAEADISIEEVEQKVSAKLNDLDGLISREGAIYIVANTLGVEVNKVSSHAGKLAPGMRNLNITLRVIQAYDTIEFNKENFSGKVKSLYCANNDTRTRVVLWNEAIDSLSDVEPGQIIDIQNCYTKENRQGRVEIHCSQYSTINKLNDDGNIKTLEQLKGGEFTLQPISKLTEENMEVEIQGWLVGLFQPRFFYTCPQCNKRAQQMQDQFNCDEHGIVNANIGYVATGILDDGTSTIRCTFFRDQASRLFEMDHEKVVQLKDDIDALTYNVENVKGDFLKIRGRTKMNSFSNQLELNVNSVTREVDLDEQIQKVREKLKNV